MQMTPETLVQLLKELSEWLEFEGVEPVEWVVCGGVALALQNLQLRTTRDVDVLGNWNSQGQSSSASKNSRQRSNPASNESSTTTRSLKA